MVEISKFMTDESEFAFYTCSQLLHPYTDSCTDAFKTMLCKCAIGTIKFYTPIYMIIAVSTTAEHLY